MMRGPSAASLIWQMLTLLALSLPAHSADSGLQRYAAFKKGIVRTTRWAHARQLLPSSSSTKQGEAVWVLGVGHPDSQGKLHATLKDLGGHYLHALPQPGQPTGLHWLIRADEATVQSLLAEHPQATVARLPADYKLSEALSKWLSATARFKPAAWAQWSSMPAAVQKRLHTRAGSSAPLVVLMALTPQLSAEHLSAFMQQLRVQLQEAIKAQGSDCADHSIQGVLGRAVKVAVCPQVAGKVAAFLAQQPEVTWIDMEGKIRLHDLYSAVSAQKPSLLTTNYPAPDVMAGLGTPSSAAYFPFWQAGLNGTGQVVGVVDSGMDMDSCYLWDPNYVDYQNGNNTKGDRLFAAADARKVVLYYAFANFIDQGVIGHGTHVVTSIVGSPFGVADATQNPDFATGVAPGARAAFFDVGGTNGSALSLPGGVDGTTTMYEYLAEAGAKVFSNSWTEDASNQGVEYTGDDCYMFDTVMYEHPEWLQVFAAGNFGDDVSALATSGTIPQPAACKNVMAVGATTNYVLGGVSMANLDLGNPGPGKVALNATNFFNVDDLGTLTVTLSDAYYVLPSSPYTAQRGFAGLPGYPGGVYLIGSRKLRVVVADPADACSQLDNSTFPADGTPVMVMYVRTLTSTCTVAESANLVLQQPQAAGVMVWWDSQEALNRDNRLGAFSPDAVSGKPAAIVATQVGQAVSALFQAAAQQGGPTPTVTVTWAPPVSDNPAPHEDLAFFSSYGSQQAFSTSRPSDYYRIKPDITAPGYIMAAASDGKYSGKVDQCMAITLQGTSMAAPQVSGAALLVRQYFMAGFYPTGAATQANTFEPSGVLVRAVLTAGTTAMKGVSLADLQPLVPPPTPFQGYGRLNLMNSLPLAGGGLGWNLQVIDNATFASQGDVHTYEFSVSVGAAGQPLSIVMVFYDAPAYPGAPASAVNNLDLALQGPIDAAAAVVPSNVKTYYPNMLTRPDPTNNVEKIYIPSVQAGTYRMTVTATFLAPDAGSATQRYAVAVLGAISTSIDSQYNPVNIPLLGQPPAAPPPVNPASPAPSGPPPSGPNATAPPAPLSAQRPPVAPAPPATRAPSSAGVLHSSSASSILAALVAAAGLLLMRL